MLQTRVIDNCFSIIFPRWLLCVFLARVRQRTFNSVRNKHYAVARKVDYAASIRSSSGVAQAYSLGRSYPVIHIVYLLLFLEAVQLP